MPIVTGTAFEEYVWSNWWLRKFPTSDWSSDAQVPLARGYKVTSLLTAGTNAPSATPKTRSV
jgi:hypothetical protein